MEPQPRTRWSWVSSERRSTEDLQPQYTLIFFRPEEGSEEMSPVLLCVLYVSACVPAPVSVCQTGCIDLEFAPVVCVCLVVAQVKTQPLTLDQALPLAAWGSGGLRPLARIRRALKETGEATTSFLAEHVGAPGCRGLRGGGGGGVGLAGGRGPFPAAGLELG